MKWYGIIKDKCTSKVVRYSIEIDEDDCTVAEDVLSVAAVFGKQEAYDDYKWYKELGDREYLTGKDLHLVCGIGKTWKEAEDDFQAQGNKENEPDLKIVKESFTDPLDESIASDIETHLRVGYKEITSFNNGQSLYILPDGTALDLGKTGHKKAAEQCIMEINIDIGQFRYETPTNQLVLLGHLVRVCLDLNGMCVDFSNKITFEQLATVDNIATTMERAGSWFRWSFLNTNEWGSTLDNLKQYIEQENLLESKSVPASDDISESKQIFYHGTTKDFADIDIDIGQGILRKGIYLTTDEEAAFDYGTVKKYHIEVDQKDILDLSDGDTLLQYMIDNEILDSEEAKDPDTINYIINGQIYQIDPFAKRGLADDIMATAKADGYKVVCMLDNLGSGSDNIATVALDKSVLKPVVLESQKDIIDYIIESNLIPSEALFAFAGWLASRDETVKLGAKHTCGRIAELVDEFCKTNELEDPRDSFGTGGECQWETPLEEFIENKLDTPAFLTYDEALKWIDKKVEEYGSKGAFEASDEYRRVYPQINKLYKQAKNDHQTLADKAMKDVGVSFGDRVFYDYVSAWGVENYSGTIVNRKGIPFVKLDTGQVLQNNAKSVKWHKGWKLKESKTEAFQITDFYLDKFDTTCYVEDTMKIEEIIGEDKMETAIVRMKNGKPQVKFPGDKHFGDLTPQFDYKSIEKVIKLLKELPANDDTEFVVENTKENKMEESTAKEFADFYAIRNATEIWTHFKRDDGYVDLRWKNTDDTIVSWDTLQIVNDAVESGYLDPNVWHESAVEYAIDTNIITVDDIPEKLREAKIDNFQIRKIKESEADEISDEDLQAAGEFYDELVKPSEEEYADAGDPDAIDKLAADELEPVGDVWNLATPDEDMASDDLNRIMDNAMEGDVEAKDYLVNIIWDGDDWETIIERAETDGSAWVVWWMDGIQVHLNELIKANKQDDNIGESEKMDEARMRDWVVTLRQKQKVGPRKEAEDVDRHFSVRAKTAKSAEKAVTNAGHRGKIVAVELDEAQRGVGKKSAQDIYRKPKRDIQKKRSTRPTKELQSELVKLKELFILQQDIKDGMKEMKNNLDVVGSSMQLVKDAVGHEIALHQDNMVVWDKAVFKFIEAQEYLSQSISYQKKSEQLEKALLALGKEGKKEVDRINIYMDKMRKTKQTPADVDISMQEARFLSEGGYGAFLKIWNKFTDWVKSFSKRVRKVHDEVFEFAYEVAQ